MNFAAVQGRDRQVSVAARQPRDATLDVTRGLIVALMALDHVRMYFTAAQFDPTDLAHANLGYFVARWVTHLCAPGFFFIAGLSAGLYESHAGRAAAARLFLVRGLWLIALEIMVFGFAWSFSPGWWWFGVIAGLGAAMVAMSLLMFLPKPVLFVAGALFTLLHNSLWTAITPASDTLNAILYSADVANLPLVGPRLVLYPLLPWLALMAMGYASTPFLRRTDGQTARRLALISAALLIAFVVCRSIGFGQSNQTAPQPDSLHALLSFMNVEKYPPSLQFSLVTLGLVLLFLAAIRLTHTGEHLPAWQQLLQTYGQVPFFFYLVHIFLIHASALATAKLAGWPTAYLFWHGVGPNLQPPDGYGLSLLGVVLVWLGVLTVMYPLCAYFGRLKRRNSSWWLKLL